MHNFCCDTEWYRYFVSIEVAHNAVTRHKATNMAELLECSNMKAAIDMVHHGKHTAPYKLTSLGLSAYMNMLVLAYELVHLCTMYPLWENTYTFVCILLFLWTNETVTDVVKCNLYQSVYHVVFVTNLFLPCNFFYFSWADEIGKTSFQIHQRLIWTCCDEDVTICEGRKL